MKRSFVIAFASLLAGPLQAQPNAWSLTPEGYGPARIGMTPAQLTSALRTRLVGEPIEPSSTCVEMQGARGYPGMTFMFEDGRLSRISIGRPSQIRTPRAINVGSREAAVRRAYGRALQVEPHKYRDRPAEYLTFWTRPGQRGVRFETDERRLVDTIHAGTASIEYVEGCA